MYRCIYIISNFNGKYQFDHFPYFVSDAFNDTLPSFYSADKIFQKSLLIQRMIHLVSHNVSERAREREKEK